jgi:predicted transcriptional regulator
MGEQLTIEIEKNLTEALLRFCETSSESPSAVVDRALTEFIAKARSKGKEKWFGLPTEDYLALPEEKRAALWNKAYKVELDKRQPPEREAQPRALPPRQRGREALRRRIRKIREESASHP